MSARIIVSRHLARAEPAFAGAERIVRRIARITGVQVGTGSATGTLRLTRVSARAVNRLVGKAIAIPGAAIGTITVTPKFG